ncbi:MAG: hypothetical protein RI947_1115 [Candidatus Parcubacteria bacterium]|jgi:hypothetical protein
MLRFSRSKVKPLLIKIFSVIAILLILVRIFLFPKETSAVWFDDNYGYRQKVTVGNTGAADTNKKVKFDIDTAALISAGKMISTCADTRFTDGNGKALQYYLDASGGACNTSSTDFYVLIPTINGSSNDTYIYMYYGYPSAAPGTQSTQLTVGTFSPTSGPTYASEEKGITPVLYWNFEKVQTYTVYDSSPYHNDGEPQGSVQKNEEFCVIGKCMYNSASLGISRSHDAELDPGTSSMSLSVWFRHGTAIPSEEGLISRFNAGGYQLYMNTSGNICFGIDDDSTWGPDDSVCSTLSYADNVWHVVSAVKNTTSSIVLYVDGKQVNINSSLTATGSITGSSAGFNAGNDYSESTTWNGYFDEIKVYNYARTAGQIQAEYTTKGSTDTTGTALGAQDQKFLSSGLVGYWKMDESAINGCVGGANDACDSSGNGNDGAYNGDTVTAAGKFNRGVTLDGTGDYISVPDSSSLDASTSVTVAAWIYVDSYTSSYPRIITKGSAYDLHMYVFGGGEGRLEWDIRIPGETDTTTPVSAAVPLNQWTHVAATYNGSSSKVYVNGKLQSQLNGLSGSITNTNNDLGIGAIATGSNYFPGDIDEARIYNRALSDTEIRSLYDWAPGPVTLLTMDNGIGATATDSSGNSNTGTWSGTGSRWVNGKMGKGAIFNGTDDYITVGSSAVVNNTSAYSVCLWFSTTSSSTSKLYFEGNSTDVGNYIYLSINESGQPGKVQYVHGTAAAYGLINSANILNTGVWHYACAVQSSTSSRSLYIDGVLQGTDTTSTATMTMNKSAVGAILTSSAQQYYNGKVDDVKIYNYARTSKQIVSDMNAGHPSVGSPTGSAVAYWNFDEGYGTTANDSYANSNSLTLNTASWTTSGKFGKAWNGDGTNWVTRASDDDFNFAAADDFSISMWVKSDTAAAPATQEYLLSKAESSPGYRIFGQTDGDIVFGIDDDSTWTPGDKVGDTGTNNRYDGNWHHVVATKTGISRLDLYIDGTLIQSDTSIAGTATLTNSVALYIGDRNGANGGDEFNGDIDEVKIYRYTLNADEVKLEYNRGKAQVMGALSTASNGTTADDSAARAYCVPGDTSTCNAPVGEWKLDENTGATAYDTSGKGNNLTLLSSDATVPLWNRGKIGSSLLFDGTTDYANNTSVTADLVNIGDVTISAWIYRKSTSTDDTIVRVTGTGASPGGNNNYDLQLTDTTSFPKVAWDYGATPTNQNATSTVALSTPLNTWFHLTAVRDVTANVVTFYENGKLLDTVSYVNDPTGGETSPKITVGGNTSPGARAFDGAIDHLRIYNYARTPAQIAWDYNRGGPIGWWKFDECQGTTAYDASGNSYNGTITPGNNTGDNDTAGTCSSGTTTEMWNDGTTGKYNSSLDFDGTNDYVDMGDRDILNAITVSAWIYWDAATTNDGIVSKRTGTEVAGDWAFRMSDNGDNKLEWMVWSGVDSSNNDYSIGTISTGAWHHVAVTFDNANNNTKFYIDGVLDSTDTSGTNDIADTSETLKIGAAGQSSDYFDGRIDDVRIYNYPLTAAQIKTTYNDGSSVRFGPDTGSP